LPNRTWMHRCRQNTNLKSDIVLAAEIRKADEGDPDTLVDGVMEAQNNLNQAGSQTQIAEVAFDKGYHAAHTLELSEAVGLRIDNREPRCRHSLHWTDKRAAYQPAVTPADGGSSGPRANAGSAAGANCANGPLPTCAIAAARAADG
jgi:hypothetical protein